MLGWVFLGLINTKQGLNTYLYLLSNSMFKTTSDSFSHSLKVLVNLLFSGNGKVFLMFSYIANEKPKNNLEY